MEVELRALKRGYWTQSLTAVTLQLIRWGGLVAIVRYAYLSIAALAGQDTIARFAVNLVGSLSLTGYPVMGRPRKLLLPQEVRTPRRRRSTTRCESPTPPT
jgi:hypothetical protein